MEGKPTMKADNQTIDTLTLDEFAEFIDCINTRHQILIPLTTYAIMYESLLREPFPTTW
jgi:hypothetical protein